MGKCRSKESCRSVDDMRPRSKRSKKLDSCGTTTISDAIKQEYAWILKKQPFVLCTKLPHYILPTAHTISDSHTPSLKLDIVSPDMIGLSNETSSFTSVGSALCKTEGIIKKSKNILMPSETLKTLKSQLSWKGWKSKNATAHSANLQRLNGNQSNSCLLPIIETGSSEEELLKISNNFQTTLKCRPKIGPSSSKVKKCNRDTNRITPCSEECCIQFPKVEESRKKKSKKKDNDESNSQERISQFQSSQEKSQSSSKNTKLSLHKTADASSSRKRTKDRKPKTKEKELSQVRISNEEGKNEVIQNQKRSVFAAINSQSKERTVTLEKPVNTINSLSGFSFRLESSKNSQNKMNPTSAEHNSKTISDVNSFCSKKNLKSGYDLNPTLSKRVKPPEYFPSLNSASTLKSVTQTSQSKTGSGRLVHNRMMEASTFPKIKITSGSSFQEPRISKQTLFSLDNSAFRSPLTCLENEMKSVQSTYNSKQGNVQKSREKEVCPQTSKKIDVNSLNVSNLSDEIGMQNLHYQENGNLLLKNSIDSHFSSGKEIINGSEYYEKDRFRHTTVEMVRRNNENLAEIKLDEAVSHFEAEYVGSTADNGSLLCKNGSLLENTFSFSKYQPKIPVGEERNSVLGNELSCDSPPMCDLNGVMEFLQNSSSLFSISVPESSQLPPSSSSQKKNIKIMKDEIIPPNCIQILRGPRIEAVKSEKNDPKIDNENSFCEQGKKAVIKKQNLDQMLKTESSQSQVSYDYPMIGDDLITNLSLTTTQEENALFNSNILDPNYVLASLSCDDFLEADIANNNEKLVPNNNRHICNPDEVKEPIQFTAAPDLSEMIQLFDDKTRSIILTGNFENGISKIDDFMKENNCMSNGVETITLTAGNLEEIDDFARTFELNENSGDFKDPDRNSQNALNEETRSSGSNNRKRRWFDEKNRQTSQLTQKVKLKRRRWSQNEGEDCTDTSSEISSSCRSSLYDEHSFVQINTQTCDVNQSSVQNAKEIKNSVSTNIADLREIIKRNQAGIEKPKVIPNIKDETKQSHTTNLKKVLKFTNVEIQKPKVKQSFKNESKQSDPGIEPVKESQVDPEPESERGDSDSQKLQDVHKTKSSPVRQRKKRKRHRSKFSPNCYSNSSSSTSDDEVTKTKSNLSDDELNIEDKSNLLNFRLERELTNIQNQEDLNFPVEYSMPLNDASSQDVQEDDILSVLASPSLFDMGMSTRCATPIVMPRIVQNEYSDNDDFDWDTYKRKNMAEYIDDWRLFEKNTETKTINQPGTSVQLNESDNLFVKPAAPLNNIRTSVEHIYNSSNVVDQKPSRAKVSRIFIGICHSFLANNKCTRNKCGFGHQIPMRLQMFQNQTEQQVLNTLYDGISARFTYYVQSVYATALKRLSFEFGLRLYNAMCASNLCYERFMLDTAEILWQKQSFLPMIVTEMAKPLVPSSEMARKLLYVISDWAESRRQGYWETVRPLVGKIEFFPFVVEEILHQCISDQGNRARILEVYHFAESTHAYQKVKQEIWTSFYKLLSVTAQPRKEEQMEHSKEGFEYMNNIENQSIASPDGSSLSPNQNSDEDSANNSRQSPINMETCNTLESISNLSYKLLPIDDLPSPQSYNKDQDNLWKFYDRLGSLQSGLKHGDYKHVVSILKQYANADRTLFNRHCHKVLAEEINKSAVHVENIIKISVQSGELSMLQEILTRLGTKVLIRLADQGLWVHAYELLKTLQSYELHSKNAGFILLAAEICLANHRLLKALTLLKQSDIIFTYCKKWKVPSNERDLDLRTPIVTLLIESLCSEFADKAFFIFDLILGEQRSNFYPVDLTRLVDKLMLSLLTQNHIDMVMNLCKKAMRYHLNFHETTFRTVLTALVPNDLILARQFYQYASYLGIYSAMQAHPITNVIINVDWSEEEMYIVVSEFLRKLFLEIGFAAARLKPNHLTVFFLFELMPGRKQLHYQRPESKKSDTHRINKSKSMMKDILQHRFDPPITTVKKEHGKICKLNSRSLVDYLKTGHFTA